MSTEGGQEPSDAAESASRACVMIVTGMPEAGRAAVLGTRSGAFVAARMHPGRATTASPLVRKVRVRFVDCGDERLERRYTKTRRPHPLAGDRPSVDGIRRERQVVFAVRDHIDLVIDTSALTAADLKRPADWALSARHRGLARFCHILRLSPRRPDRDRPAPAVRRRRLSRIRPSRGNR
jgi:P-loop ATPase protein family